MCNKKLSILYLAIMLVSGSILAKGRPALQGANYSLKNASSLLRESPSYRGYFDDLEKAEDYVREAARLIPALEIDDLNVKQQIYNDVNSALAAFKSFITQTNDGVRKNQAHLAAEKAVNHALELLNSYSGESNVK